MTDFINSLRESIYRNHLQKQKVQGINSFKKIKREISGNLRNTRELENRNKCDQQVKVQIADHLAFLEQGIQSKGDAWEKAKEIEQSREQQQKQQQVVLEERSKRQDIRNSIAINQQIEDQSINEERQDNGSKKRRVTWKSEMIQNRESSLEQQQQLKLQQSQQQQIFTKKDSIQQSQSSSLAVNTNFSISCSTKQFKQSSNFCQNPQIVRVVEVTKHNQNDVEAKENNLNLEEEMLKKKIKDTELVVSEQNRQKRGQKAITVESNSSIMKSFCKEMKSKRIASNFQDKVQQDKYHKVNQTDKNYTEKDQRLKSEAFNLKNSSNEKIKKEFESKFLSPQIFQQYEDQNTFTQKKTDKKINSFPDPYLYSYLQSDSRIKKNDIQFSQFNKTIDYYNIEKSEEDEYQKESNIKVKFQKINIILFLLSRISDRLVELIEIEIFIMISRRFTIKLLKKKFIFISYYKNAPNIQIFFIIGRCGQHFYQLRKDKGWLNKKAIGKNCF